MASAGGVLGVFCFIFIFGAIGLILNTNAKTPACLPSNDNAPDIRERDQPSPDGHYRIQRDYRIEIPPQCFAHYPFGVRIVLSDSMARETAPSQRGFEARDYVRWSPPEQDPHLRVQYGHIDFQADTPEPAVRIALKASPGIFEAAEAVVEKKIAPYRTTEYSLWLNPLQEQTSTVFVVLSQQSQELATHPLPISIEAFPIRLR